VAAAVRVGVLGVGPFGRRVAALLAPHAVPVDGFTDDIDVLVAVLWRPAPALCAELGAAAGDRAWLPVVVEHPHLVVGPYVAPGGPCLDCYQRRRQQHESPDAVTADLHAAYDADPALGPAGFLPHQARYAAALVLAALREARAGWLTVQHLVSGSVATHHVIGVHDCARCGEPVHGGLSAALAPFLPAEVSRAG
jgi:bacteriocin biosynthesis cyclodehydratase domain-containing protein